MKCLCVRNEPSAEIASSDGREPEAATCYRTEGGNGDAGIRGRIYPRENASEFPVSIVQSDSIEACKIKAPA
jgi:hypothetical protein